MAENGEKEAGVILMKEFLKDTVMVAGGTDGGIQVPMFDSAWRRGPDCDAGSVQISVRAYIIGR